MRKLLFSPCLVVSGSAVADCFDDAATAHGVNPWVLRGIAKVESSFNPKAVNKNKNGTTDLGIIQINSMHLPRLAKFGISRGDLFDACNAIHVGAFLLREKMDRHGNTWTAVGAYHSETPQHRDRYSGLVRATLQKWSRTLPVTE